jgi:hypothetical membrane protein
MKNKNLVLIAGVSAIVVYLIFTTVAFFKYPAGYSPLTNWLSDLGNPLVNQSGALFYNLGCVLTSLVLIVFYIGMREWNNGNKRLKVLLTIAQTVGLLSSIFLIVAALFPLGTHTPIHEVSGKMHVVFLGFFLTLSATVLLKHPVLRKWPAYFGFLTAAVNFVYGVFLHFVFVAEWVAIGMFIIYVLMISYNSGLNSVKEMAVDEKFGP